MPVQTFTTLNDPLATDGTLAHGINGSGQIVGQYANNNTGINGFLLSGGTYTTIADPLATQHFTEALGTRDRSSVRTAKAVGSPGGPWASMNCSRLRAPVLRSSAIGL